MNQKNTAIRRTLSEHRHIILLKWYILMQYKWGLIVNYFQSKTAFWLWNWKLFSLFTILISNFTPILLLRCTVEKYKALNMFMFFICFYCTYTCLIKEKEVAYINPIHSHEKTDHVLLKPSFYFLIELSFFHGHG